MTISSVSQSCVLSCRVSFHKSCHKSCRDSCRCFVVVSVKVSDKQPPVRHSLCKMLYIVCVPCIASCVVSYVSAIVGVMCLSCGCVVAHCPVASDRPMGHPERERIALHKATTRLANIHSPPIPISWRSATLGRRVGPLRSDRCPYGNGIRLIEPTRSWICSWSGLRSRSRVISVGSG